MQHAFRSTVRWRYPRLSAVTLAGILALASPVARANAVPVDVQVGLLGKVARYDRAMPGRVDAEVKLLVYSKPGQVASERAAAQVRGHLEQVRAIMGTPVRVVMLDFVDAQSLARDVDRHAPAVVIVTPGMTRDVASVAAALDGKNVLTMSLVAEDVEKGIVLGFDLVATKPRIVVNLRQARRQGVDFTSQLLSLAKVYR
jgi:hypothetical protein